MNWLWAGIRRAATGCFFFSICGATVAANVPVSVDSGRINNKYSTWLGIEPDKWATIWLLKRYQNPSAYFIFTSPNTPLPEDSIRIDVPDAEIRRIDRRSMFSQVRATISSEEPALDYLQGIIQDIEINIWDTPAHPHSPWLEAMFRQLQSRYSRDQVPVECYLQFFDAVAILAKKDNVTIGDYQTALSLREECPGLVKASSSAWVDETNHLEVLRSISLGKKIIFLDTRETEEFDEVHLPGARLVRLRDVNASMVASFSDADLVVPYCVKDFRGFEVAKAIKDLGFDKVATLSPNGLKGWLNAELPIVRAGSNEEQALEELMQCAMEASSCLEGSKK